MSDKQGYPEKNTGRTDQTNTQEKTDPQITELKGFIDPNEKLEPMADQIDREKNRKDDKAKE